MADIFEKAARKKLRFKTSRGSLTSEDLWDLTLAQLDTLAIALNKEVKEREEVSFVTKKSGANLVLTLKFEIVKRVIDVKLAEAEANEKRAATKARNERIKAIMADKQDDELKGKSLQELEALLAEGAEA